jgi:protein involved in polysaccharide export with SLBB domain
MSTRNIILKHKDGTQQRVDLPKYFATREEKWNPYLREGDIIVVPRKDPAKNVIAVYGQVNTNGRFEFVEGDSLLDAIKLANGFTGRAIPERAIFSRLSDDGTSMTNRTISLANVVAGLEPNIPLQPGDRIIINGKPDLREDFNVDVGGEVNYPGTYPITRDHTRLSEVIREAGGFTEFAALENAEVVRRPVFGRFGSQIEREQALSMRGTVSSGDTIGYTLEAGLRLQQEAVTVDFRKLFDGKDSTQDIILQREDQIYIPSRARTVYVFGQVATPGHIPLIEGRDSKYYVEKAGGFTDRANGGDLRIIKAKTKQWLRPVDTRLEAGDNIWVPAEVDQPFSYYMTTASQAATILSVVIGVAFLIVEVSK